MVGDAKKRVNLLIVGDVYFVPTLKERDAK